MQAIEFITQLSSSNMLSIPEDAAARLPRTGKARVIVLTGEDADDAEWRKASYEEFMREDPVEDSVYDKYG